MNTQILNCCKDCTERKIGCHDVNVCEKWKLCLEVRKELKQKREKERNKRQYAFDESTYIKHLKYKNKVR